jgi:hypothetical protein
MIMVVGLIMMLMSLRRLTAVFLISMNVRMMRGMCVLRALVSFRVGGIVGLRWWHVYRIRRLAASVYVFKYGRSWP